MKRAAIAAGMALLAAIGLSACNAVDLQAWPERAVYLVIDIEGDPYLAAVDPVNETVAIVADLRAVGVQDAAVVDVQNGPGSSLLSWTDGRGQTNFATIDESGHAITTLDIHLDTGAYILRDEALLALLPATSGSAEIVTVPLSGTSTELTSFSEYPTMFVRGTGEPAIAGNASDGSVFVQYLSSPSILRVSDEGILAAAIHSQHGMVVTIANEFAQDPRSRVAPEVIRIGKDGELIRFGGLTEPRLLAEAGNFVAIDDSTSSGRTVSILDLVSMEQVSRITLQDSSPVQGLVSIAGLFVVVQERTVTWIDPTVGTHRTADLPGYSLSGL